MPIFYTVVLNESFIDTCSMYLEVAVIIEFVFICEVIVDSFFEAVLVKRQFWPKHLNKVQIRIEML